MTLEMLEKIGIASYGNTWQTDLSKALGVNSRTVRRWASGETPIPKTLRKDLLNLLERRGYQLENAVDELTFKLRDSILFNTENFGSIEFFSSKERAYKQALFEYSGIMQQALCETGTHTVKQNIAVEELIFPRCLVLEIQSSTTKMVRYLYACKFLKNPNCYTEKELEVKDRAFLCSPYWAKEFDKSQAGVCQYENLQELGLV